MHKLPENWKLVRLLDAGVWLSGGTPSTDEPRFWGGHIPWISAASLKSFHITESDRRLTTSGASAGTRLVPSGSVLFVVRGMSLKKEFRVGVTGREVAFGQDCKAIIPHPGIDGGFLAAALKVRTHQVLSMVDEAGHGTGRLPTDLIADLKIGIPCRDEQRRITSIFDALDQAAASISKLITKHRLCRIAHVRRLMSDGLRLLNSVETSELSSLASRNEEGWSLGKLGTALIRIEAGNSPSVEDTPAGPGEWGVLKVSAVGPGGFRPNENKVAHDRSLHAESLCVRAGDLIISRANTTELVGIACIVRETPPHLMLCDKTLRLHVDLRRMSIDYVHLALSLPEVRRQIEIAATGTSGSMKNISQPSIRGLMIPWADRTRMDQVVQVDAGYGAHIDALNDQKQRLALLKQGLMNDLLFGRVIVSEAEGILEKI